MNRRLKTLSLLLCAITVMAGNMMSGLRKAPAQMSSAHEPAASPVPPTKEGGTAWASLADPPDSTKRITMPDVIIEDEDIPDSLLNPRWKIQRTVPVSIDDLDQNPADLNRPENLKLEAGYNGRFSHENTGISSATKSVAHGWKRP